METQTQQTKKPLFKTMPSSAPKKEQAGNVAGQEQKNNKTVSKRVMGFRNLKIRIKTLSGFAIMILLIIGASIYIIGQFKGIASISREVEEANGIAQAALDFNVENFHTQLEVWEYAYEPNAKRLKAFEDHNEKLTELLDELVEEVKEENEYRQEEFETLGYAGLYEGGLEDIQEIVSNLKLVREDWKSLLAAVGEVERLENFGYGDPNSPNHMEYMATKAIVLKEINENEALFDELEFNKEVDKFVSAQGELVHNLSELQKNKIDGFITILAVIIGFIILFGVAVALFISRSITKPIEELRQGTEIIEKGNLDYKVGYEGGGEIGQLARAFDKMTIAIKQSRAEVDKKVKEQTHKIIEQQKITGESKVALEKMNKSMTGREMKMIELKKEIMDLKVQLQTTKK